MGKTVLANTNFKKQGCQEIWRIQFYSTWKLNYFASHMHAGRCDIPGSQTKDTIIHKLAGSTNLTLYTDTPGLSSPTEVW